jgi:hypothetical protein
MWWWIVIGIVGSFVAYHFVLGFIGGLGIRRKPRFKVIWPEEK